MSVVSQLIPVCLQLAADGEPDPEVVRANIDIGGPGMIRAGVRNFLRVATVVDPDDYGMLLDHVEEHSGCTRLKLRLELARKAFRLIAKNDTQLAEYLGRLEAATLTEDYEEASPSVHPPPPMSQDEE